MAHCWDEYLEKVHNAVPVDPWATNVQLLDVFIHERSSSAWLPAWLHTRKAPLTRVGSMLTLGVKNSHNQQEVANADSGTSFSQSINKDGTFAGLQGSGTNASNGDGAAAILERVVSGEVPMYDSLVIKVTSMPDVQTSIKSSTSLLASFTGGSAAIGQFDVKGSKTVNCNISGVKSRRVEMDTLMELVTPRISSGLPPLWHPDILLPQLQWSSKRGQTFWVVIEIMCANKIKIEANNQMQANSQAKVLNDNVSNQVNVDEDGVWTVIAAEDNPTFPFALRLLKLDYDACEKIITTKNKKCLHRSYSLNKKV